MIFFFGIIDNTWEVMVICIGGEVYMTQYRKYKEDEYWSVAVDFFIIWNLWLAE